MAGAPGDAGSPGERIGDRDRLARAESPGRRTHRLFRRFHLWPLIAYRPARVRVELPSAHAIGGTSRLRPLLRPCPPCAFLGRSARPRAAGQASLAATAPRPTTSRTIASPISRGPPSTFDVRRERIDAPAVEIELLRQPEHASRPRALRGGPRTAVQGFAGVVRPVPVSRPTRSSNPACRAGSAALAFPMLITGRHSFGSSPPPTSPEARSRMASRCILSAASPPMGPKTVDGAG